MNTVDSAEEWRNGNSYSSNAGTQSRRSYHLPSRPCNRRGIWSQASHHAVLCL